MVDISSYSKVFRLPPNHGYSEGLHNEIIANRRKLDNKLFFDRLVETLGVKGTSPLHRI
jgi:hypothetical protein